MKVDNTDLSDIVNEGDPIKQKLFDNNFTWKNIWKWWYKAELISINRNNKVCEQLKGEKGCSESRKVD